MLNKSNHLDLMMYTYIDWVECSNDRRSLRDTVVYGVLISEKVVSRFSTKFEYRAIVDGAAEVTWITILLDKIGIVVKKVSKLSCDNVNAKYRASNPMQLACMIIIL